MFPVETVHKQFVESVLDWVFLVNQSHVVNSLDELLVNLLRSVGNVVVNFDEGTLRLTTLKVTNKSLCRYAPSPELFVIVFHALELRESPQFGVPDCYGNFLVEL